MERRNLYILLAVVLALSMAVLAGCGDDEEAEETETTEALETETTEGMGTDTTEAMETETTAAMETETTEAAMTVDTEGLYAENCAGCHGESGEGIEGDGPNLTVIEDADAVATAIRNGAEGMPAFEGTLSDEEIDALATWVVEDLGM